MAKQVTIKELSEMAGVSPGTIDRVLHNRGKVSAENLRKINDVLSRIGYKQNIHTSAVAMKKTFRIVISAPAFSSGDYWDQIHHGLLHALEEYSDLDIELCSREYNQFDLNSCREAFAKVLTEQADAVIIGPTFNEPTRELCGKLDRAHIPYVFVDTVVEGANQVTAYSTDQHCCGMLLGRLISLGEPATNPIAILQTRRVGNMEASNPQLREEGMMSYFSSVGVKPVIKKCEFSPLDHDKGLSEVSDFIKANPEIKTFAVMNSRGYLVAEALHNLEVKDSRLFCFDLTSDNRNCLEDGSISALVCQRPESQGFNAIKSLINFLLYRKTEVPVHLMPVDVVYKENLNYYKETI